MPQDASDEEGRSSGRPGIGGVLGDGRLSSASFLDNKITTHGVVHSQEEIGKHLDFPYILAQSWYVLKECDHVR